MGSIYLFRHGETEWAKKGKHTGHTDIPLTLNGEHQAQSLMNAINTVSPNHIFSSPLIRALDTCKICGYDPIIEKDLIEWNYGEYEGLTKSEIQLSVPNWDIFTHGAKNGETLAEIKIRAERFISKISDLDGNIFIFSSGHILRSITALWLSLPLNSARNLPLSTASISILGLVSQYKSLLKWNITPWSELKY